MAKKKIINVYLSFPFVGRTKKNIEATMNYMKHEAEKYLRGLIGVPPKTEIRYVSLYGSYDVINGLHFCDKKKRQKAIIDMVNELESFCDYFIRFDYHIAGELLYKGELLRKLKSNEYNAIHLEYELWRFQDTNKYLADMFKHQYRIYFLNSTAVLNAFPEFKKMQRQELIKEIRRVSSLLQPNIILPEKANN